MKLLLAIATYKRPEKLKRLMLSLKKQSYKDYEVVIVFDNNDFQSCRLVQGDAKPDWKILFQKGHKYVIGAWNRAVQEMFIKRNYDGFMGLCDDVEMVDTDFLQKAVDFHKDRYADGDGVIGFKQECPGHPQYTFKWYGQTLMGRKFIERYASVNYQICCPDYLHFFQDEEMYEYASSMDKFYRCQQAVLYHYHPSFIKKEMDETHDIIRKGFDNPKNKDFNMRGRRSGKNYLWGKDFKLIGNTK